MVLIGAFLIFVLSASIKVALYVESNTRIVPAKGGELREGMLGQPVFISPVIPTTNTDRELSKLVFGTLDDIADSITHSGDAADGKTWNVRIKQGVLWQDGKPVTSDDVIFTLGVIQDKANNSPLFSSFQGITAERVSELEVKFTLQSAYALFDEENLKSLGLIPQHLFSDSEIQNAIKLSVYGLKPIGFGPYQVDSYDKDDRGFISALYLSSNSTYFRGEPNISKFTVKFYKNDADLINAYKRAQIDAFGLGNAAPLLTNRDGGLKDSLDIRHNLYNLKYSGYYALFINQIYDDKNIQNIKVREALAKSLDVNKITRDILGDYATPLYGPVSSTLKDPATFDASILSGLKVTITLPDQDFLVKTAGEIKAAWEAAGVEVTLNTLPLDKIQDAIKKTDYEIILFGNVTGPSGDLFSFWHSSQRFYPGNNLSLYQNKKVDNLIESFGKDFDADSRTADLKQISDIIAADYPAIFLYSPQYIYVAAPSLRGIDPNLTVSNSYDRFLNVEKWYLRTSRVFR